jgi:predicted RNA-binding Zn-ribbon protein involved in translation (DUF1610 family)
MFSEQTYVVERNVTCNHCGFDGPHELDVIIDNMTEMAEWVCPTCDTTHDYVNNRAWDLADEYHDRMKEGWL